MPLCTCSKNTAMWAAASPGSLPSVQHPFCCYSLLQRGHAEPQKSNDEHTCSRDINMSATHDPTKVLAAKLASKT